VELRAPSPFNRNLNPKTTGGAPLLAFEKWPRPTVDTRGFSCRQISESHKRYGDFSPVADGSPPGVACYDSIVFNFGSPKTPGDWLVHLAGAIVAIFLVWWMLRVYVL
jgi:hypothetical protein